MIPDFEHVIPVLVVGGGACGSKPLWIKQMFEFVERNDWIRSVVWFDVPKQADWRVATSPAAERAFVDGVARMQGRVAGVAAGAPAAG